MKTWKAHSVLNDGNAVGLAIEITVCTERERESKDAVPVH